MCECGWAETNPNQGYLLPDGTVVLYQIYRGCADCFAGPGIDISFYKNRRVEWLRNVPIKAVTPDEYGGQSKDNTVHCGTKFGLFEVQDLRQAARAIETQIGEGPDDYATLDDWLDDFGLEMVQSAMRIFRRRMAEIEKRRGKK